MGTLASVTYQCGWVPEVEPTVVLSVDPPVVMAPDGVVPRNTKIYADLYVNGVRTKPDALGPLFGSTSGAAPDTAAYTGVRWLWNTTDPRFGFTVQKGTVLSDFTRPVTAMLGDREYTGSVQFARVDGTVGYELFSPDCEVRFGSDGRPNRESVGVTPYLLKGGARMPLPVNDDAGAEHCVIFRSNTSTGMLTTSRAASALGSCSWARFDLVRREDVEMVSLGGGMEMVGGYEDSAILATCPVILTHDGVDGSSAAFTSIVFYRSDTQPAKPSGGTYKNPIPTAPAGWSDAPPTGTKPLWLSRARFLPDTTSPDWSTPSSVQDSTGIEYIFSKAENPGTPADTHPFPANATWTKDATDAVWMAIAVKNNGVWEAWKVLRVKGESGKDGKDVWTPPPMQWSDYPKGYSFQAAEGDSNRVDCVIHGTAANGLMMVYRCIKPHKKGCGKDEPGIEYSQYWAALDGGPFHIVATNLLLAANAIIDLLTSNGIRVMKSGTTDKVSLLLSGGEWPLMAGSDDPDKAVTKIHEDGTFYSTKAVIEGDVVFGGRVKPMVTKITSSNYTKYRARWNDVFNDDSEDNIWILDFRTLSGSVILDSSLNSVASSQLALYMIVSCQYQTASGTGKRGNPEEYIGSRMRIENNTSKAFSLTGLITNDRSTLASGISPTVQPGHEIDLECFVKAAYGKRAIGWYIEYQGPKG